MNEEQATYDVLRIYDGNSSDALLLAEVSGGYHYNVKISSNGPQMFITFDSDEVNRWRGFYATFHEELNTTHDEVSKSCSQDNPCKEDEGQCYSNKQCDGTLKCGKSNCLTELGYQKDQDCCFDYCGQWLDVKNGLITSPEYPNLYNNNEECIWTISAEENQTVILQFVNFEVVLALSKDILMDYKERYLPFQLDELSDDYIKVFDGNTTDKAYLQEKDIFLLTFKVSVLNLV